MKKWDFFLGFMAFAIVACFMLPRLFGFQYFTQWGGMYTDGWCSVEVSAESRPSADERGTTERILAGDIATWRLVWFPPMHRADTCVAWARSYCGKTSPKGITIQSVFPYYRGKFLAGGKDICTFAEIPAFHWFTHP